MKTNATELECKQASPSILQKLTKERKAKKKRRLKLIERSRGKP